MQFGGNYLHFLEMSISNFAKRLHLHPHPQLLMFRKLTILTFIILGFGFRIHAQISHGGIPKGYDKKFWNNNLPRYTLPSFDVKAEMLADSIRESQMEGAKPFKYGKSIDVNLDFKAQALAEKQTDGATLYRLKVASPGAITLNFTFDKYRVPVGGEFFVYTPKHDFYLGSFNEKNNQEDGYLGVTLVPGDEMILEYYEPAWVDFKAELVIRNVVHAYKDLLGINGYGQSGACNMNVNCPQGQAWQDQKKGVALILSGGADACTGSMINNVRQDGKPYFLTANHCFDSRVTTWVFVFNWESPGCTNQNLPRSQSVSGSQVRARLAASDFLLLELNQAPPESYNVYFSGWDSRNNAPTASAVIHHPSGDIKKIAFDSRLHTSTSYGGNTPNTHWRNTDYDFNTTTEPGSSGSPLFDQNKRIVGQLHGGQASCTNRTWDAYGKVAYSWGTGTTPATRLRDWLDPDNTGLPFIDGYSALCAVEAPRYPYFQGFEGRATLPQTWRFKNEDNDSTFRVSNAAGGYDSSAQSAFVNLTGMVAGRKDYLWSPAFPFATRVNARVIFDWAYAPGDTSNGRDSLSILLSTNCGGNFTTVKRFSSSQMSTAPQLSGNAAFVPDATQWATDTVYLGNLADRLSQAQFGFMTRSGGSGKLYIDNFRLLADSVPPLPVVYMNSDKKEGCVGSSIQFTDSSTNDPIEYFWQFPGGNPATSDARNPTVVYSNPGTFNVILRVTNAGGIVEKTFENYVSIFGGSGTFPFVENFNGTTFPPTNWFIKNPNSDDTWQRADTIGAVGSRGSLYFRNYQPDNRGKEDYFLSPKIVPVGSSLKLRFNYAYTFDGTGTFTDSLKIGYSRDCGATTKVLWIRGGVSFATSPRVTTDYRPAPTHWRTIYLDLDSLALYTEGFNLVFINKNGWGNNLYIDDISFDSTFNCNAVSSPSISPSSVCVGQPVQFTANVPATGTNQFRWTGPGAFGTGAQNPVLANPQTVNTGWYRLFVINNQCYSIPDSVRLTVSALPAVPTISNAGGTLTCNIATGVTYQWFLNGDTIQGATSRSYTITQPGRYRVTVTNVAGCSRNSVEVVITSVRAFQEGAAALSIYPNPSKGTFHVQLISEVAEFMTYRLVNLQGQVLQVGKLSSLDGEVDIAVDKPGLYLLEANSKSGKLVYKLVKE